MKKNGFELNTKDYDVYSLKLPVSVLFGKKREKFVVTELGKRHPCFSDEFCFEVKLVLKRNGLEAKTVVMKKMKLAELKMECGGKRMFVKEVRGFVFDSGVFLVLKKCLRWIVLGILCTGLVLSLLVCEKRETVVEEKALTTVENENQTVKERERADVAEFLETVKTNNGRLDWFEWRCEESFEAFEACVGLLYPEVFYSEGGKMEVSAVSYTDGKPSMVVKEKVVSEQRRTGSCVNYMLFVPAIREILKRNDAQILEENQEPFCVKFKFKTDFDEENNILCELGKAALDNNLSISYFMLRYSGAGMFDAQIMFSKVLGEGVDVEKIGQFVKLFEREEGRNVAMRQGDNVTRKESGVVTEAKVNLGKKIGEVKRNGARVVFFKGEDGKVRWENWEN